MSVINIQFILNFEKLGELSSEVKNNLSIDIAPLESPYVFTPPRENDVFSYKLAIGTKPGSNSVTSVQVLMNRSNLLN